MTNINWQNLPSETTPINSTNLNVMSAGLLNVSSSVDDTYRVNLLHSKNLFDISKRYYDNALSQNVFISLENGIFSANISSGSAHTGFKIPVEIGEEYTIKWTGATGLNSVQTDYFRDYNTSATRTITATTNVLDIRILSSGSSLTINNLQIEKGSTATSYSPFIQNKIVVDNEKYSDTLNVGTSLDSRSRVNVLKSKNLYNYQDANTIVDNVNIIQQTNKITTDNTCKLAYIKCKPSTTYTISRRSPMANRFVIATTSEIPANNVDTLSVQAFLNDTTTSITITTPANAKYIVMRFINNKTDNDFNTYAQTIQVEEGSTATTYEPFIQNQIVVDNEKYSDTLNVGSVVDSRSRVNVLHSKNLTDGIWENGGWSNTGEKADSPSFMRTANPIYVKPNTTYTLKISQSNNQIVVYYYSASAYINLAFVQNTDTYTFTTPANCVKINFRLSGQSLSLTNTMLNEGSTALPYEQYVTPSINVDGEMLVSKNVYSTGEVVIGEWLGKPLYRKIYSITNPSSSNTDYEDLTSLNIDRLVHLYGYYKKETGTFGIPFYDSSENYSVMFLSSTNKLRGRIAYASGVSDVKVIIEYTKTTE